MNLGENIYNLRTEKNLSQGGLADALEVSRQSVSKWENNSAVPELDKLVKMAEIFGVTLDELVTGKAQVHPVSASDAPRPTVSTKTLIGIALLCCAILSLVMFLIFPLHILIVVVTIPLGILSAVCLAPNERFLRILLTSVGIVALAVVLFFAVMLIINLYNLLMDNGVASIPVPPAG